MRRTLLFAKLAIIAIWLLMLGLLARKHISLTDSVMLESSYLDEFIESREEWVGIYLKQDKVGYGHYEIKRTEDGYQIREDVFMDMSVMHTPQKLETSINAVVGRDLSLSMFSFRMRSGFLSFIVYGTVDDNRLRLRTISGGKEQKKELRLSETPVLANSLKYYILKQGLVNGAQYRHTFFDPVTLSNRTISVRVEGEDDIDVHGEAFRCYKINQSFMGVELYTWINQDGETVREESPMGLILLRENKNQALYDNWGDRPDVVAATAVKIDQPFATSGISYLKIRLQNIQVEDFDLHGGRQTLEGATVLIRLEKLNNSDTYVLPFNEPGFDAYLEATQMVQSDSNVFSALAAAITGNTNDAQKAVQALTKWVHKNIEKRPTLSIPNALEVLRTKQGDCNEHAVLLAALCRSIGIPSKLCAGLVYMQGSFYYHAWLEVYLNRWISVDPTMSQFPADVTHIRFIEGDLEQQLRVLQLVGRIKIDVLEHT